MSAAPAPNSGLDAAASGPKSRASPGADEASSRPSAPAAHIEVDDVSFDRHLQALVHEWSKTLTALGFTLVPLFFLLDSVTMPRPLLRQFGVYRLAATVTLLAQYVLIYRTRPGRRSHLHGYFVSLVVGGMIVIMTRDLGGFDSAYYAGLNLVIMGVILLLPWTIGHSMANAVMLIGMYVGVNAAGSKAFHHTNLINNLYFLSATALIAISISYVRHQLIRAEFDQRDALRAARDALRGEMEIAKRIQTALLPNLRRIGEYEVAATMLPADEVGGDYYDIIVTEAGERWVAIGDVSGHGVESGLIMMMTQTSIFTTINHTAGYKPSTVLNLTNSIMKENISRLGTDRYMTISVARLEHDKLVVAGKHQDILIYRHKKGITEFIPTRGTWLGILEDISDHLVDTTIPVEEGDVILLFTDGLTEATNAAGVMFGERNLERALAKHAHRSPAELVAAVLIEVRDHMTEQRDDISLLALKRTDVLPTPRSGPRSSKRSLSRT